MKQLILTATSLPAPQPRVNAATVVSTTSRVLRAAGGKEITAGYGSGSGSINARFTSVCVGLSFRENKFNLTPDPAKQYAQSELRLPENGECLCEAACACKGLGEGEGCRCADFGCVCDTNPLPVSTGDVCRALNAAKAAGVRALLCRNADLAHGARAAGWTVAPAQSIWLATLPASSPE